MISKYKKLSFGGIILGGILIFSIAFVGLTNGIANVDVSNNTDVKAYNSINDKSIKSLSITLSDDLEGINNRKSEPSYSNLPPYSVNSEDVKKIVNELKRLGAAKVFVNGEQISEKSEIIPYAQFIKINGKKYIAPFIVRAQWNENISEKGLLSNNSVIDDLKSRRKIIVDIKYEHNDIYSVVKEAFLTEKGYTDELTKHMSREVFEKMNIYSAYPVNSAEYKWPLKVDFKLKEVSQEGVSDIVYVKMMYSVNITDSQNKDVGGSVDIPITFTVKNSDSNWYIINKEEPA